MWAIMTSDEKLQQGVKEELKWDSRLKGADIRIFVNEGVVTLTGNVPSLAAKFAAEKSAKGVREVKGLSENIEVKLSFSNQRNDADIAQFASALLAWHVWVPRDVKVTVDNGWLTLTGEVNFNFQKKEAERVLRFLRGVRGVSNLITIMPMAPSCELKAMIEEVFERNAEINLQAISVQVNKGRVILSGSVRDLIQREKAELVAWGVPGVFEVLNKLKVNPEESC
jgi:osmotically-inducible protein OsmY